MTTRDRTRALSGVAHALMPSRGEAHFGVARAVMRAVSTLVSTSFHTNGVPTITKGTTL